MMKKMQEMSDEQSKKKLGSLAKRIKLPPSSSYTQKVANFYGTVSVFTDFLKHTSKNPKIFDSLALSLSDGDSFQKWLKNNHKKFRLKPTMEGLNKQWMSYVKKNR
jgi:hypothetical protein